MKLNNDCVRDLLLYIEDKITINDSIAISQIEINKYTSEELIYTAMKLKDAGYVKGNVYKYITGNADVCVNELTWDGHKFLDNIRDDGVWKTTKEKLSKFSSVSLSIIENVASQVITNLINQQMGQ